MSQPSPSHLTQVRLWIQNQFLVCGDSFVLCQWFSGKMEWRDCIWFSIVEFSLMITSPVWCRWLAYLPFTQDTRVRVPVPELLPFVQVVSSISIISKYHLLLLYPQWIRVTHRQQAMARPPKEIGATYSDYSFICPPGVWYVGLVFPGSDLGDISLDVALAFL